MQTACAASVCSADQDDGKRRAVTDQLISVFDQVRGRIAASMLDIGQQTPILVRADGARFVLVEGLHRRQGARRENHHRLRRGSAQALNGPPVVLAGDAAAVT
jgi:hypothetical protein